jgi:hypothetical protein
MRSPASSAWLALALGLGLVALADAVRLQMPARVEAPEPVLAPPPELLLVSTLGHRRLAADLAWLDATAYYGSREGAVTRYARLASTLASVVLLDPNFRFAYLFGGLALSTTMEGVEAADALLRQGAGRFPTEWRFPFYLGFNAMLFREEPQTAAVHFATAGRIAGSPPFLLPLALRLAAESGNCEQSLRWIAEMEQQVQDPIMRHNLERRRRDVVWECNFQLLEAAAKHYTAMRGHPPARIQEFVDSGLLSALPVDPWGGSWGLDASGQVTSSTRRKRLRVHLPPRAREDVLRW